MPRRVLFRCGAGEQVTGTCQEKTEERSDGGLPGYKEGVIIVRTAARLGL